MTVQNVYNKKAKQTKNDMLHSSTLLTRILINRPIGEWEKCQVCAEGQFVEAEISLGRSLVSPEVSPEVP